MPLSKHDSQTPLYNTVSDLAYRAFHDLGHADATAGFTMAFMHSPDHFGFTYLDIWTAYNDKQFELGLIDKTEHTRVQDLIISVRLIFSRLAPRQMKTEPLDVE